MRWHLTGVLILYRGLAFDHTMDLLQKELTEDDFASAWAEGRTMTLEQAVEYALSEDAWSLASSRPRSPFPPLSSVSSLCRQSSLGQS